MAEMKAWKENGRSGYVVELPAASIHRTRPRAVVDAHGCPGRSSVAVGRSAYRRLFKGCQSCLARTTSPRRSPMLDPVLEQFRRRVRPWDLQHLAV